MTYDIQIPSGFAPEGIFYGDFSYILFGDIMFATLELYEKRIKGRERIKYFLRGAEIICEKIALPENEYFYKLKVPVIKGKIPYDKLRRLSEGIKDGFIFPEGLVCEEGIKEYSAGYFPQLMLFNSAVKLLSQSICQPADTLITLVDSKGVLSSQVKRLADFAGEVRVITENVNSYFGVQEEIMRDYGLSLFVSNKLSSIPKEGIIISYTSSSIPLSFRGLLITSEKRFLPFADVLTGRGIKTVEKYMQLCPERIEPLTFLSALCESCYVKELQNTEFEKLVDISSAEI